MMILLIAIAAELVTGPMPAQAPIGWATAPARPFDHEAPRDLQEQAVLWCCDGQGAGTQACKDRRGAAIRARTHDLHWVGLWYTSAWRLPPWASYWPVAQACRESRFKLSAIGDGGRSIGFFQLQESWIAWWSKAGRRLDRLDPVESARVLMHGVARSYRLKVAKACPKAKAEDHFRLAVARTTRSPWTLTGVKVPRCDFWVRHRDGHMRQTAGTTVAWAQKAWKQRRMPRLTVKR